MIRKLDKQASIRYVQEVQKGIMGISLNTDWFVPFSNATQDHDAALRALDFMFGW